MPHSKTPGGQAASDKFLNKQAQAQGTGASDAPGHTELQRPGDAPVAGDSYTSRTGVEPGTNQPGEKGNTGAIVGEMGSESINQGNMK